MQSYRFLNRSGYLKALADRIAKVGSGERVVVAAMDFDPHDSLVMRLFAALRTAAGRGASVKLLVDAHNFLSDERGIPGPLFYRFNIADFRGVFGDKLHALQELEAAGGAFCITNFPKRRFSPPPMGRSHIKGAVIGDVVYLGGCNLEHPEQLDVMLEWRNEEAAAVVESWLSKIADAGSVRTALGDVDVASQIDASATLLLDAGVPKQSLIYDEALQLIDDAQSNLYMTCQYFPGGKTARHLVAALSRGVDVRIYYSHPRSHHRDAPLQYAHQLAMRSARLPHSLFAHRLDKQAPKLHAKILISETAAMIGSHNYVQQGVNFGTAEIALKSTDTAFIQNLRDFAETQIRQNTRT